MTGGALARAGIRLAAVLSWVGAFLFAFTTVLHNDHFDRIVHARQVARYGELPFRDFLDPGYFMTEFASAGLQRLLGDRLLGDLLLDASFIATGTVIVLLLARRASGSLLVGWVAALLALLAVPRLYDFDKVLFYPLGVMLCWRYAARPTLANLVVLGAGAVGGALFRYDTGLYIGLSAVAAIGIVHWGEWTRTAQRLGALAATVLITALPFLLFVALTGGLRHAADQIVTYAVREGARTRIASPPRFSFAPPVPPQGARAAPQPVRIRWAVSVDENERRELAERHGLRAETLQGEPGDRTWGYTLEDPSPENIRALVADPRVEDTHGIDRSQSALAAAAAGAGAGGLPTRWLPGVWNPANASAFVYYLLFTLPLAGVVWLFGAGSGIDRAQRGAVVSLAVMCLALDLFILRDPVYARIGGMGGPPAVMAAWLAARAWRSRRVAVRVFVAVVAGLTIWAVSTIADWQNELRSDRLSVARVRSHYIAYATPAGEVVPYGPWLGMVTYLRECTSPGDRVYASWFAPELYFYAQRGFAAGVSVTFGGHWSEPRFQQRMIEIMGDQSVPVVLVHRPAYDDFQRTYPAFSRYLEARYEVAGETSFGDASAGPGAYRVLAERNRPPSRVHADSGMPCFR